LKGTVCSSVGFPVFFFVKRNNAEYLSNKRRHTMRTFPRNNASFLRGVFGENLNVFPHQSYFDKVYGRY